MAKWVVVVSREQYEAERMYGAGGISVPGTGLAAGDEALLVTSPSDEPARDETAPGGEAGQEPAVVFGLARADADGKLHYTVNLLDAPLPAGGLAGPVGARRVDEAAYLAVAGKVERPATGKRTWLVSVDLPIEAASPGEAVRAFWSFVRELGPAELPAFVWPAGDELAMQAYVLGAEANQDPEED
ncbi:hypothetical protein AB0M46_03225 [Dactylosporangium sp. NPDC051485]|uniref:hypothetical protein n=1 Tax=Dactylosporangium sp. NPDC051485 TaxID=3154846 RepID=UPI00341615FA